MWAPKGEEAIKHTTPRAARRRHGLGPASLIHGRNARRDLAVECLLGADRLWRARFCHSVENTLLKAFKQLHTVASFHPELRCTLAEEAFVPQRVFPLTVHKGQPHAIEHQVSSASKQVGGDRDSEEEILS